MLHCAACERPSIPAVLTPSRTDTSMWFKGPLTSLIGSSLPWLSARGRGPLFPLEQRVEMVREAVRHLPNVEVDAFEGLLVEYVRSRSALAVVRGLRAVSDFEFEFQLALMNRKLDERIETIFMMPKDTYTFLSSRIVKEIARLGGDVSAFVPAHVQAALKGRFSNKPA